MRIVPCVNALMSRLLAKDGGTRTQSRDGSATASGHASTRVGRSRFAARHGDGDPATAERLIAYERDQRPDANRATWIAQAIDPFRRERWRDTAIRRRASLEAASVYR